MSDTKQTIYVAHVHGVEEVQATLYMTSAYCGHRWFSKNTFRLTYGEAVELSSKKRANRIASLKRAIAKLEAIK